MADSGGTSDLDALAADLEQAAKTVPELVRPIMSRAGLNVKRQMVADMSASGSFRAIAASISYDTNETREGTTVEIGPDKARAGGALANIAYFGSPSRSGGATVPDPLLAAEAELPNLERFLADLVEGL